MSRRRLVLLSLGCSLLALSFVPVGVSPLHGEPTAVLAVELGRTGGVVVEDNFDREQLGDKWKVAKGSWTLADGALLGQEVATDKHAAVATIGGSHRNSVIRFRFQLNGAKQFALSLNKQRGHLFRVVISENGLTLSLDKDKSDPESKPQVLARAQGVIEPNHWHTLQLEMLGDRVLARTDSGLKVAGQHESLDCDKPGYRFVVGGESVRIDDLVISALR
ncbi:MAG: hypothetical protein KDA75_19395 [Planctomycetaceae bacterium]|nr:hypothetical protein [Planctomycetaceae bacterium]